MPLSSHQVILRDGSRAKLFKYPDGRWACPVCGSGELTAPAYTDDGGASFEMCSCGFEFGYDDDPGASTNALASVQENWAAWRSRFLRKVARHPEALAKVRNRLLAIEVVIQDV